MKKFKVTLKYEDNTSLSYIGRFENAIEATKSTVERLKDIKKNLKFKKFVRLIK